MSIIETALSRYGSRYSQDFESTCNVSIPKGSNWCGVFVGWCLSENSLDIPEKPQVARSYLKIGKEVESPQMGDICVFWRESRNSWKGHVNIFIREEGDLIHCLGGNQGGLVQILKYKKNRLLGFRRLQSWKKSI